MTPETVIDLLGTAAKRLRDRPITPYDLALSRLLSHEADYRHALNESGFPEVGESSYLIDVAQAVLKDPADCGNR